MSFNEYSFLIIVKDTLVMRVIKEHIIDNEME